MDRITNTAVCLLLFHSLVITTTCHAQVFAGEDITVSAGLPLILEGTYTGYTGIPVTAQDDFFVGPLPIGFEFVYFGVAYNNFAIGPNGLVSFNLPDILSVVHWTNLPIPNSIFKSTIMGPYQDLFQRPGAPHNQYIYYLTVGTAPERKLIAGWCEAPMFGCNSTYVTVQVVLHEQDNVIENHLISKPACDATLANKATQGLNFNDVTGVAVPGRNNSSWTASGETWLFTPDGSGSYTITSTVFNPEVIIPPDHLSYAWYKDRYPDGELLISGQRLIVHPMETTQYFCEVTLCGGLTYVDDLIVKVIPIPNAFNPNSPVEENRTFRVFAQPDDRIINYRLLIYNRWGQLVFESTQVTDGWDGEDNGKLCNAGVYAWVVYYDAGEGKVTNKGVVTLIR